MLNNSNVASGDLNNALDVCMVPRIGSFKTFGAYMPQGPRLFDQDL